MSTKTSSDLAVLLAVLLACAPRDSRCYNTPDELINYGDSGCYKDFIRTGNRCFRDLGASKKFGEAHATCANVERRRVLSIQKPHCKDEFDAHNLLRHIVSTRAHVINHTAISFWTAEEFSNTDSFVEKQCLSFRLTNGAPSMPYEACEGSAHEVYCQGKQHFRFPLGAHDVPHFRTCGANNCPRAFRRVGEKSYFLVNTHKLDWFDAQFYCSMMGTQLARLDSAVEMRLVNDYLLAAGEPNATLEDGIWIAGNDLREEGSFERLNYTQWHVGEPNNDLGNENCVQLRFLDGQHYMNDYRCLRKNFFLCQTARKGVQKDVLSGGTYKRQIRAEIGRELKLLQPQPAAPELANKGCPRQFARVGNSCYYLRDMRTTTWFGAQQRCRDLNATMLRIDSSAEMIAFRGLVADFAYRDTLLKYGFWSLANDLASLGSYHWGQLNERLNYSDWFRHEPENHRVAEGCVQIKYLYGRFLMLKRKCLGKACTICESDLLL